ncbi:MAG TPA: DUF4421 family protein [Spirochaetota bacterium]|nr:DUF4421 family protein [Spirochaetota bacterium]HQE58345.1 DUF4421 family protein [Spirochaetota bacterium]
MKGFFYLLIFCFSFLSLFSAERSTSEADKTIDPQNKFAVKLFTEAPLMSLNVTNGDNELSYDSNAKWASGFSVSYKKFGFSMSKSWWYDKSTEKHGKTKTTDYQLYMFKKHIGVELYFQKMKGVYMDNPGSYDYSSGDAETIRSDIKTRHIGTNAYYSFSDNFSLANAFDCQNIIDKSSGSFLLCLGLDYTKISSDSGFIPSNAEKDFDFASDVNNVNAVNFYAGAGYAHAFVYKGFFAAVSVIFAAGPSITEYNMRDNQDDFKKVYPVIHYNMKYLLGYNEDSFMMGIYAFWHASMYGKKNCSMQIDAGKIGFFAGTRF